MKRLLKVRELCAAAGVPYETFQTWIKRGHSPVDALNPGRGVARLFTEKDALELGLMARLVAAGVSPKIAAYLVRECPGIALDLDIALDGFVQKS